MSLPHRTLPGTQALLICALRLLAQSMDHTRWAWTSHAHGRHMVLAVVAYGAARQFDKFMKEIR